MDVTGTGEELEKEVSGSPGRAGAAAVTAQDVVFSFFHKEGTF